MGAHNLSLESIVKMRIVFVFSYNLSLPFNRYPAAGAQQREFVCDWRNKKKSKKNQLIAHGYTL